MTLHRHHAFLIVFDGNIDMFYIKFDLLIFTIFLLIIYSYVVGRNALFT